MTDNMPGSRRQNLKALLLSAGLGTRLRPLTDSTPKCLVNIVGRPLLDYWFDRLELAGVRDILINTHHQREQIRCYIQRMNRSGCFRVREAYEPKLLGSAGTVSANREWVDDTTDACLIVYTDSLSDVNLCNLIRFHHTHDDPLTMMLFRTEYPRQCGIAELNEAGQIVSFVEKPDNPKGNLANAGVYVFTPDAFRETADMRASDIGFDVLPKFVGRMRGWVHRGYHLDIGTPETLEKADLDAPRVFADVLET